MNPIKERLLNEIEIEIRMSLENSACLGKDAYGDYIKKLTKGIMIKVRKL